MIQDEIFVPDSSSWQPGYGLVEATDLAWANELEEAGLSLDPVLL